MHLCSASLLLFSGCDLSPSEPAGKGAAHVGGPCRAAPVRHDRPPAWTDLAGVPPDMPYAVASPATAAAFFFRYPLVAGPPDSGGARNKVLWVVRGGSREPFVVTARSDGAPTVRLTGDSNGASGEVQRTILELPAAGCWRLDLRAGDKRARVDVDVCAHG
jgi:hypothetical protein